MRRIRSSPGEDRDFAVGTSAGPAAAPLGRGTAPPRLFAASPQESCVSRRTFLRGAGRRAGLASAPGPYLERQRQRTSRALSALITLRSGRRHGGGPPTGSLRHACRPAPLSSDRHTPDQESRGRPGRHCLRDGTFDPDRPQACRGPAASRQPAKAPALLVRMRAAAFTSTMEDRFPGPGRHRLPRLADPQRGRAGAVIAVQDEAATFRGREEIETDAPDAPFAFIEDRGIPLDRCHDNRIGALYPATAVEHVGAFQLDIVAELAQEPEGQPDLSRLVPLGDRGRHAEGYASPASPIASNARASRQLVGQQTPSLLEPKPGGHEQLGKERVAFAVAPPPCRIVGSIGQPPAQANIPEQPVVLHIDEAGIAGTGSSLSRPADAHRHQAKADPAPRHRVPERRGRHYAFVDRPAIQLLQRRDGPVPGRSGDTMRRLRPTARSMIGRNIFVAGLPRRLAPAALVQEAQPGQHVARVGAQAVRRAQPQGWACPEETVEHHIIAAVVAENERDTVAQRRVGRHRDRRRRQLRRDAIHRERPRKGGKIGDEQLRHREGLPKRGAYGASLLMSARVFPLALPPFATWQGCRPLPAPLIKACGAAAASTVVLASLREQLTRTSACHASSGETGTKSPDNAAVYAEEYGSEEPVTELIPAMLTAFIESDRAFAKACARHASSSMEHKRS